MDDPLAPPPDTATMSDASVDVSLSITIVKASGLSVRSLWNRKPNAYALLKVGGASPLRTSVVKGSATPAWQRRFTLAEVSTSSTAALELVDDGFASIGRKITLGRAQSTISALLESCSAESGDIELALVPNGTITICVRKQTAAAALAEVDKAIDNIAPSEETTTVSDSLQEVINCLEKLKGMIDSFSRIHPYAHAAWKIVTSIYNVVKAQLDRDARIVKLVHTMKKLYTFVEPLESMNDGDLHKSLENVVELILKQTIECVSYIQEYAGHGFMGRTADAMLSSADKKIDEFSEAFVNLSTSLDTGLGVQTTLVSLRVQSRVEELVLNRRLDPVKHEWGGRLRCQPDTRLDVIKYVTNWVFDASGDQTNVLWLHGLAGSGKSTLATSIADFFAELNRLGAFIFFDRDLKETSHPLTVVRTLACELSRFDKRIHDQVMKATDSNAHIARMQLDAQFRELLLRPLKASTTLSQEGPIVIVIDALDECGTEGDRDRDRLLGLLATETAHLPASIRIIITSRTARDIETTFTEPYKPHIHIHELETDKSDISKYIRQQVSEIAKRNDLSEDWPEQHKIEALVERAAGLFIWASTACRYFDDYDAEDLLDQLVEEKVYAVAEDALDVLYVQALRSAGDWNKSRFRKDGCAILGVILAAKSPLSPDAIDRFLTLKSMRIISKLGSVLHHQQGSAGQVRILHASFREYLSNRERCKDRCVERCSSECDQPHKDGPWFIDLVDHNQRLGQQCIPIMEHTFGDKFCNLSLDDSLDKQTLDDATAYACTYWTAHVCEMKTCPEGFDVTLLGFLSKHILHWLEAMSMLERSRSSANMLERLLEWVAERLPTSDDLHELVYDASRFAGSFASTIAEHPALVSLSALPFAPLSSPIYKLFHNDHLPVVLGGYQMRWSQSLRVFERWDNAIFSLAFSPDESMIVSVGGPDSDSSEAYLRLWDASTGLEAVPARLVYARSFVAFSLGGERIWAASVAGKLLTLDAANGEVISELAQDEWAAIAVQGNQASERDRRTLKARRLSSSARDGKVQLGSVPVAKPLGSLQVGNAMEGLDLATKVDTVDVVDPSTDVFQKNAEHSTGGATAWYEEKTFSRMAFGKQAELVVFGHEDGTLHVVDMVGRRLKYPALKGLPLEEREFVRLFRSIDFSPDESRFASGSSGGTIQVWDASTGKEMVSLSGHTEEVTVLKYIDDSRIISSSEDGTIRTWNALTGDAIHVVTAERVDEYQPLCIDPRGEIVVSTSLDGNIGLWDVESGKECAILVGNFNAVSASAFSSQGARLVTGAFLNNIQIWDVTSTGKLSSVTQRHARPPHKVEFSLDGFRVRSWREDSTKFWDTVSGRELAMDVYNWNAKFNEDGSAVISVRPNDSDSDDESASENDSDADVSETKVPHRSSDVKAIVLLDAESRMEWQRPTESDSPWVDIVASAGRSETVLEIEEDEVVGFGFTGVVKVQGASRTVWRLPLELRLRSHDVRGSFITMGTWNGRVFTLYLPDEVVNMG